MRPFFCSNAHLKINVALQCFNICVHDLLIFISLKYRLIHAYFRQGKKQKQKQHIYKKTKIKLCHHFVQFPQNSLKILLELSKYGIINIDRINIFPTCDHDTIYQKIKLAP